MSPAFFVFLGLIVAQPPAKSNSPQPGTVRVAVVNLGYVFNNYDKARKFKTDLEVAAAPYNAKSTALQNNIDAWKAAIAAENFRAASKEEYEEKIADAKRDLEKLAKQMRKELGQKSEDNLVALWAETQEAISDYATENGIELVFGFGEPLDKALTDRFPNINRKMNAMDGGAAVPLFVKGRADISIPITKLLNARNRKAKDGAKAAPNAPAIQSDPSMPLPPGLQSNAITPQMRSSGYPPLNPLATMPHAVVPHPAAALLDRGSVRWREGEFERAIADFGEAIRLSPGDAKPYQVRGMAFIHRRDYDQAVADFSIAIKLTPKEVQPYVGRANAFLHMGKFDQAIADLDAVTRLDPKNPEAYLARGMVRYLSGEPDLAIAEIDAALRLDPRCPDANFLRGRYWHAKGDLPRAIADFNAAIALKPDDHDAHFLRGRAHGELGNHQKAVADFTKFIEARPQEGRGYGMRALAYFALGDSRRAWADTAKACELSN